VRACVRGTAHELQVNICIINSSSSAHDATFFQRSGGDPALWCNCKRPDSHLTICEEAAPIAAPMSSYDSQRAAVKADLEAAPIVAAIASLENATLMNSTSSSCSSPGRESVLAYHAPRRSASSPF